MTIMHKGYLLQLMMFVGCSFLHGGEVASQSLTHTASTPDIIFDSTPSGAGDTLEAALCAVYRENPEIQGARSAVRASDEKLVQARAGWKPQLSANARLGYGRQLQTGDVVDRRIAANDPTASKFSRQDEQSVGLELSQNLFNGGATVAAIRRGEAEVRAARAELLDTEQSKLLEAIQVFLDLMAKSSELRALKNNESVLKATLRMTEERFDVGEETRTSVAQAQAQYFEAVARRQSVATELTALRAQYRRVTGRDAVRFVRPQIPNLSLYAKNFDQVLDRTIHNFPKVIAGQFHELSARKEVDRTRGQSLPQIDLSGRTSAAHSRTRQKFVRPGLATPVQSGDTVSHGVELTMRIPLYSGGSLTSQTREAAEIAERRRVDLERVRRQAISEVTHAWETYQQTHSNIKYLKQQVQAYELSLSGTQEELGVGSKILLDVLNEQRKLVEAERQLIQAERDHLFSAYRLLFYMGHLNAGSLKLKTELYDPEVHYQQTGGTYLSEFTRGPMAEVKK